MLEKSQEYLRLAMAAAALLVGMSVAYHYVIYVPQKDRAHQLSLETKVAAEAEQLKEQKTASEKAALERRANYRICISNVLQAYDARWTSSCKTRSELAEKNRSDCLSRGISEDYCRSSYPPLPSTDCTLPNALGDDYDDALKEDKNRCLQEAQSGVLAPS